MKWVLSYHGAMDIVNKVSPWEYGFLAQNELVARSDAHLRWACHWLPDRFDNAIQSWIQLKIWVPNTSWQRPDKAWASWKAVFVWWGEKRDNGKSTLINLLKLILGSYCKSASK
jgi:hypothetical protein